MGQPAEGGGPARAAAGRGARNSAREGEHPARARGIRIAGIRARRARDLQPPAAVRPSGGARGAYRASDTERGRGVAGGPPPPPLPPPLLQP